MNWDALGAMAELVGAIAVLATLVYLAIQVRENALQLKLGSATDLNHLINEAFDPIYSTDRNIRIWTSGIASPESLDEEDLAIFSLFLARLVHVLLTAFMHDSHEILESEAARRYLDSLKSILDTPGGQYWLKELGGDNQLSDQARDMLSRTEPTQDFLVTSARK